MFIKRETNQQGRIIGGTNLTSLLLGIRDTIPIDDEIRVLQHFIRLI